MGLHERNQSLLLVAANDYWRFPEYIKLQLSLGRATCCKVYLSYFGWRRFTGKPKSCNLVQRNFCQTKRKTATQNPSCAIGCINLENFLSGKIIKVSAVKHCLVSLPLAAPGFAQVVLSWILALSVPRRCFAYSG
jgi:hypothetical protein